MKNTYFIALKSWNEPHLIKLKPYNSIAFIGLHYKQAYIMESKAKAEETRRNRYKTREERKNDEKYPDFF